MSDETLGGESSDLDTSSNGQTNESSSPSPAAPQAAAPSDVWSTFRSLPDFKGQDDRAIAGRLYSSLGREKAATKALSQYQQLIPYAQEYLTHREAFEQWRDTQGKAPQQQQRMAPPQQAPAPAEAANWWNPPAVRESYKQYMTRDQNGREVISPDAPLDAQHALYEYQKYKSDFAQKFLSDPQAALGPMVEKIASERAQQIMEAQLQETNETAYVSKLESDNRDWLYEDGGKSKTPTREGLMIQKYIALAAERGIQSVDGRFDFACDMVERDLQTEALARHEETASSQQFQNSMPPAQMELQEEVAPTQNQAEKDIEYLRREASRNPSRSQPASDARTPRGPMTFEQRLRAQMSRDGLD